MSYTRVIITQEVRPPACFEVAALHTLN